MIISEKKDPIERKNDHLRRKTTFLKIEKDRFYKKNLLNEKVFLLELQDMNSVFIPSFPAGSCEVLREIQSFP